MGSPFCTQQLWFSTGTLHVGGNWCDLCSHQPESQMDIGCRHSQMLRLGILILLSKTHVLAVTTTEVS
jgi:hypothetical protein